MSFKEMHDGLANDARKLQIKVDYLLPKAVKAFRKSREFPAWQSYDYKIPSTNNQYVIFFYVRKKTEIEHPHYTTFGLVFNNNQRYVITGLKMGFKQTPESETVLLPQVHALTSHFLQRYRERFLRKPTLSANETAGIFLARNFHSLIPITINEEVNSNIKEYGEFGEQGFRVPDGFCFTKSAYEGQKDEGGDGSKNRVDAEMIIYTTYMNEAAMTDTQRAAINKEHFEVLKQMFKELVNS